MTIDLDRIRAQFPSLSETDDGKPRLYFDNPAGTQVPQQVADRMANCLLHKSANIGGHFKTSELAEAVADEARAAMADFLNAPAPEEIIFGQNMTSLTFHLSRSIGRYLQPGDEIILSQMEHDANIEPWVLLARDFDLEVRWLEFNTETFEFDLSKLKQFAAKPVVPEPGALWTQCNQHHTFRRTCRRLAAISSFARHTSFSVRTREFCGVAGMFSSSWSPTRFVQLLLNCRGVSKPARKVTRAWPEPRQQLTTSPGSVKP